MTLLVSAIAFAAALGLITGLGCATCRILTRDAGARGAGMCFLAGVSATALLGGALAFMGLPPTPFILVAAAASSGLVMPRPMSWRPAVPLPTLAFALPVLVALVALLVLCLGPMPGAYDAIADWVYKARSLTGAQFHPLPWRGPAGSQHPEYPLGLPALDASLLTCTRSYPWLWLRAIQVTMLAALVACVWRSLAGRELMRTRRLRDAVVLGVACGAALLMPRIRTNVILANADLPVATLLAGGLLLVVQSLQRTSRRRRRQGLTECALLLCGAAAIKQEGAILLLATLAATAWITRGRVLRELGGSACAVLGAAAIPYGGNALTGTHDRDYSLRQPPHVVAHKLAEGWEMIAPRLATDAVLICAVAFVAVAVARNRHDAALRRSLFLITAVILCELVVVTFGYGFARGGASSLAAHSFGRILVTPAIVTAFVAIPLVLASAAGRARSVPDQPGPSTAAAAGADAGGCGRDRLLAVAAADLSRGTEVRCQLIPRSTTVNATWLWSTVASRTLFSSSVAASASTNTRAPCSSMTASSSAGIGTTRSLKPACAASRSVVSRSPPVSELSPEAETMSLTASTALSVSASIALTSFLVGSGGEANLAKVGAAL